MTGLRSAAAVVAAVTAAVLGLAAPAAAHVSVSADGARPGATDVTLLFTAAAESDTSGINALRVTLPEGIDRGGVRLADGPPGWRLRATRTGFQVSGTALAPGADARYSISVSRLPAGEERLAFPTDQVYADGRVDAWRDVGAHGTGKHQDATGAHPAPVLELTAGAPGAAQRTTAPVLVPAGNVSTGDTTMRLLTVLGIGFMLVLVGAVAVMASRRTARH